MSLHNPEGLTEKQVTLETITTLTSNMAKEMKKAVDTIQEINEETHILALNAAIEASSAGSAGKGFGVVAEHMEYLSNETGRITKKMNDHSQSKLKELETILSDQSTNVRGNRLCSLGLANMDLIDRNLYERSADIRWWAKDESVVNALTKKDSVVRDHLRRRLEIILKFYTIYYDLIVCDMEGIIVANGRGLKDIQKENFSDELWFKNALNTPNGNEFGFQTITTPNPNGDYTLVFSCKVHENGDTSQKPIGILCSVFNWSSLSDIIIKNTPISDENGVEKRICIIDNSGNILADSDHKILEKLNIDRLDKIIAESKNFVIRDQDNKINCIAHAKSPGFEGYSAGYHSVIMQSWENDGTRQSGCEVL